MAAEQPKKVELTAEQFAERARITNWGVWILLGALAAMFVLDVVTLIYLINRLVHSSSAPELMALAVMIIFLSIVILTVVFFFLAGLGYVRASALLKWLGGITIAELAGMATMILGYYFKKS